ncbi:MAG TPA: hypothetical protein VG603_08810 [Chitinophagales bacterium]|nr:hypothetical protein [Chitinophagales bacterium]
MELIKNTWFGQLYANSKWLFALVCIYGLGILYYAAHQREEFPFLLYGMYSLKVGPSPTYTAYSIELGEQEIKYIKLRDAQREMIGSNLEHAMPMIEDGTMSADEQAAFKKWLMNYCNDMRISGDNKMNVYKLTCYYDETGKVHVLKKELVLTYATE